MAAESEECRSGSGLIKTERVWCQTGNSSACSLLSAVAASGSGRGRRCEGARTERLGVH